MTRQAKTAIRLANEILSQPEFSDLKPLRHPRLIRCNVGSYIPPNHVCYGDHTDNPGCKDCAHQGLVPGAVLAGYSPRGGAEHAEGRNASAESQQIRQGVKSDRL